MTEWGLVYRFLFLFIQLFSFFRGRVFIMSVFFVQALAAVAIANGIIVRPSIV